MTHSFCLLLILVVSACDAAVDGNHRGEAIATIHGALPQTSDPRPAQEVRTAIAWIKKSRNSNPVGGVFPDVELALSGFRFDLYEPPADDFVGELYGSRFATALIVLATQDDDLTNPYSWRGLELNRLLVYFPEVPNSDLRTWLDMAPGEALLPGYHVFDVYRRTDTEYAAYLACVDASKTPNNTLDECGPDGTSILFASPVDLDTQFEIVSTYEFQDYYNHLPHL